MGLQLIFVVETNRKCKSDWIYIKDTIDYLYEYDKAHIKFTPIYMDGKGNYKKKETEIKKCIAQYSSTSKSNKSQVIYCFDCDDYDIKGEDLEFLESAQNYCRSKGYHFVWFCKDIERVYVGKKVDDKKKQSEAVAFKEKKLIAQVDIKRLSGTCYKGNTSNIMNILNQYLHKK